MSTQAVQVQPFDALKKFLDSPEVKQQIQRAAPKHLSPDRQLRIVLTAALGQPKIAECCTTANGKASIIKAMLTATQRGLELDGRQGHLVPFNDKRLGMVVQFIPGYQGLIDLAYNHPKVKSIWWNCVHERDEFVFKDGLSRVLDHVKYDGDEEPGALRYAYAVCELDGGAKSFVVLNRREVMKAKGYSRGAGSEYSPWQTNEAAMWGKTAVRALCKQIPQSAELRDALTEDDEASTLAPDPDDRFRNAKQVVPTVIESAPTKSIQEQLQEPDPEPAPTETPAPAPAQAPKAAAKPVVPPATAPAAAPTAAAPAAPATVESVQTLRGLIAEKGIGEDELCKWACAKYKLSPSETLDDVLEIAPRRITLMLSTFPAIAVELRP